MRRTTGAVQCPRCGRLVGATEPVCPFCGARHPGMFGYGPWFQRTFGAIDLSNGITGACIALYVLSLALDPAAAMHMAGLFDILAPGGDALVRLGLTSGIDLHYGRWWTTATAVFLHGSLLHIAFNMVIMRRYLPMVEHLFGSLRAFVIFMLAGILGFVVSDLVAGHPTIGASGAIFGLFGALVSYGRRTGQSQATQQLLTSAFMMFVFGFFMPSVNNFAHAGGFIGGFLAAELMPTTSPREGLGLMLGAIALALFTLAGFVLSFIGYVPLGLPGPS